MSYLSNIGSSAVIDAVLTRSGRLKMASDKDVFLPVKFAFSDDEVNYQLLHPDNVNQDEPRITSLPIPEPSTNDANEMVHKIWVNATFLGNRFGQAETTQGQHVFITSSVGDRPILYSDDTSNKVIAWVNTFDALDKPFIGDFYRLKFTDAVDYYHIQFVSPPLTDSVNNNWTKLSDTEYVFSRANADGSGHYDRTSTGAPSVVFNILFRQTPQFFSDVLLPQNADSIQVDDFVTVTQVDSARTPLPEVRTATMPLTIKIIHF